MCLSLSMPLSDAQREAAEKADQERWTVSVSDESESASLMNAEETFVTGPSSNVNEGNTTGTHSHLPYAPFIDAAPIGRATVG